MRRLLPVLVIVPALLGACGPVSGDPAGTPVTTTSEIVLYPFDTTGEPAPGVTVTDEVEAQCGESNVALGNPAARRCSTTDAYLVHDPCFLHTDAENDTALCVRDPVRKEAVRLTVTEDTGPRTDLIHAPWFLELADGRSCVPTPAPEPEDEGEAPTFACSEHGYLYGMPDTTTPVWTIAHSDQRGESADEEDTPSDGTDENPTPDAADDDSTDEGTTGGDVAPDDADPSVEPPVDAAPVRVRTAWY